MKFSTVLVLVGMFIISLYFLIEVEYYAYAVNVNTNPADTPYIKIPKIGVNESINNRSIDYGIYYEPKSYPPGKGTTILFGHRTLHGSPFLKLDQLKPGDKINVEWPSIGNAEYTVVNSTIVDSSYQMPVYPGNTLYLITCYPLGSDAQRLIIGARYENTSPIQTSKTIPNPQAPMALLLIATLFSGGMILGNFYPVKEDRILLFMATIALTLLLVFAYFFPVPTNELEATLSQLNGLFGIS